MTKPVVKPQTDAGSDLKAFGAAVQTDETLGDAETRGRIGSD